jgi:tetraprenyl-beta-curcumene synthase
MSDEVSISAAFAAAAARYWLLVFPVVVFELRHWRRSAARIHDPELRRLAFEALQKRSNMEGAAAFAVLRSWRHRRDAIRALVAFQTIYNHVDMLAEQASADPEANARRLHEALLLALDPGAAAPDRKTLQPDADDGGYLAELIEVCRWALSRLPGYASAAPAVRSAATRIVAFQSLSLGEPGALEAWARREASSGSGFEWFEAAAAAGSSLPVHALIAASMSPELSSRDVVAIDGAYSSVIGALHSLLDSVVDEAEDAATGQLSLIGCYDATGDAVARMRCFAERAPRVADALPQGRTHALLAAAMACSYISRCERSNARAQVIAAELRVSLGPIARPLLLVFGLRALAGRFVSTSAGGEATPRSSAPVALVEPGKRGAGARVA